MDFKIVLGVYGLVFIFFILIDVLKYLLLAFAGKEIRLSEVVGDVSFWFLNGLNLYFQTIWLGFLGMGLWFSMSFMGSRWFPVMYGKWIRINWRATNHLGHTLDSLGYALDSDMVSITYKDSDG